MNYKQESERLFDGLFVLELANNHWGNVDRGLRIITDFSRIVRFNNVKASIKLQFRDVDRFVHRDFRERSDIRYIKKTLDTQMSVDDYKRLIDAVRASGAFRCPRRSMRNRFGCACASVSRSSRSPVPT